MSKTVPTTKIGVMSMTGESIPPASNLQYFCDKRRVNQTVTVLSKKIGCTSPLADIPHHTVNLGRLNGILHHSVGFSSAHYTQLGLVDSSIQFKGCSIGPNNYNSKRVRMLFALVSVECNSPWPSSPAGRLPQGRPARHEHLGPAAAVAEKGYAHNAHRGGGQARHISIRLPTLVLQDARWAYSNVMRWCDAYKSIRLADVVWKGESSITRLSQPNMAGGYTHCLTTDSDVATKRADLDLCFVGVDVRSRKQCSRYNLFIGIGRLEERFGEASADSTGNFACIIPVFFVCAASHFLLPPNNLSQQTQPIGEVSARYLYCRQLSFQCQKCRNEGAGKREIPEKTRRPTASSGTIPTCKNPVTRPGIEPGSPWWETSVLIGEQPNRMLANVRRMFGIIRRMLGSVRRMIVYFCVRKTLVNVPAVMRDDLITAVAVYICTSSLKMKKKQAASTLPPPSSHPPTAQFLGGQRPGWMYPAASNIPSANITAHSVALCHFRSPPPPLLSPSLRSHSLVKFQTGRTYPAPPFPLNLYHRSVPRQTPNCQHLKLFLCQTCSETKPANHRTELEVGERILVDPDVPTCCGQFMLDVSTYIAGGTVAERLASSPPTKVNRAQSLAGSSDFRKWESCRTMPPCRKSILRIWYRHRLATGTLSIECYPTCHHYLRIFRARVREGVGQRRGEQLNLQEWSFHPCLFPFLSTLGSSDV
ncbi:hypothetical protein PR048_002465 [Dryococelus australis]|uniref:Uncharacterized protein n=1 Tax=Dryococelus australis TaxID=614101 RepID=A0ABQ9IKC5_9NEOP|nr:hypothetical protein PR048_002465 [Dryococelus australis]